MKNFTSFFVSLFYIGYIKFASGTLGSFVSIAILYFFFQFHFITLKISFIIFMIIIILSLLLINLFSKQTSTHDSRIIIIDEFLGIYFIFLFYENLYFKNHFLTLLFIFILFRFFDIIKIFPANIIDKKIKNPFGVILDDIVAAIYTILTMYIINVIF